MNLWVAFAGLLAGAIVWACLVRRLTSKSWERHPDVIDTMGAGVAIGDYDGDGRRAGERVYRRIPLWVSPVELIVR